MRTRAAFQSFVCNLREEHGKHGKVRSDDVETVSTDVPLPERSGDRAGAPHRGGRVYSHCERRKATGGVPTDQKTMKNHEHLQVSATHVTP